MAFQVWKGEHSSLVNKTSVSVEIRTFNVALSGNGKCWEKADSALSALNECTAE